MATLKQILMTATSLIGLSFPQTSYAGGMMCDSDKDYCVTTYDFGKYHVAVKEKTHSSGYPIHGAWTISMKTTPIPDQNTAFLFNVYRGVNGAMVSCTENDCTYDVETHSQSNARTVWYYGNPVLTDAVEPSVGTFEDFIERMYDRNRDGILSDSEIKKGNERIGALTNKWVLKNVTERNGKTEHYMPPLLNK